MRDQYHILALDHESTLRRILAGKADTPEDAIVADDLVAAKRTVLELLQPEVTGMLLDPAFYQACANHVSSHVHVLLKLEQGWTPAGSDRRERLTRIHSEWPDGNVPWAQTAGVKLMIYYRPDGSPEVIEHQRRLARQVGEQCAVSGAFYCLEPTGFALTADERRSDPDGERVRAGSRPEVVIESVKEFGRAEYQANLMKLDFPADLRYVAAFNGRFDSRDRKPLYDLDVVRSWCVEMTRCSHAPWTVMSSGASNAEFVEYMRIALAAGASGYICGQGFWKQHLHVNRATRHVSLDAEAVNNVRRVNALMNCYAR